MSSKNAFYRRTFLNRPRHHLGAHVIGDITIEHPTDGRAWVDATVHLSDCSRHITLDFSAENTREAANSLRKVRLLRSVLDDFESALLSSHVELGLDASEKTQG